MKTIALTTLALTLLCAGHAIAADNKDGKGAQTSRMSQCSAEAKEKGYKGDARKEHMSQCLRAPGSQLAAKECNATADQKGLKGAKRKDFVADCVKSKGSATVG
jgi:hypothetical protein